MSTRNISISLLLAVTLGLSGCGGGGGTPDPGTSGDPDPVVEDRTAPTFTNSGDIDFNPTIEEDSANLEIATIVAEDENGVAFDLDGEDKEYFELTETRTRAAFSTVLKFKARPDFEAKDSAVYHVSVKATDNKGNSSSKDFVITLTDKPFVFDVTGRMGSVVHNASKTLTLVTKEAKRDNVDYSIAGSGYFVINNNDVVFNAPDFNSTIGADNSYSAIVTANDGNSDINLTVSATVVLDPNSPALKTYLLKSKNVLEAFSTYYDYKYYYDADNYLIKVEKLENNVVKDNFTRTYQYFDDHKIMKGYDKDGKVDSIRVFEDKKTTKNKFAANIEHSRLSVDEYVNYMSEIFDTASYKDNRHMVKYIRGLSNSQTLAELYVYNNDDRLSRVLSGNYTIESKDITSLTDAQLEAAQLGSFPSASDRLSDDQLNSLNSGTMPFQVNRETTFIYTNSKLTAAKGIDYLRDTEGNLTSVDMHDFDVDVEYYSTNVLQTIDSNIGKRVVIDYDYESELKSVNDNGIVYNYSFNENGKNMTVAVTYGTQTVATYNFEEE